MEDKYFFHEDNQCKPLCNTHLNFETSIFSELLPTRHQRIASARAVSSRIFIVAVTQFKRNILRNLDQRIFFNPTPRFVIFGMRFSLLGLKYLIADNDEFLLIFVLRFW